MTVEINELPSEEAYYYFGPHGFYVTDSKNLSNEQVGYSIHPDGTDLTGKNEGDWKKSWYTIGRDTTVGDPFFVDTSEDDNPVYTAMHGQGDWSPDLVSESLSGFISSLEYLKNISGQSEELVWPNDSTIKDDDELENIKNHLVSLCGSGSEDYWDMMIEQHQDWVIESEDE